ncbi:PaaI family thioesterase [Methylobacterium sp. J-076]|uniref:PaaI family thioesterase n=1 Tax=Methylobacterium sp. J-076 TaxID=2836655 RepID=UPI001FB95292|nr:PaaI family thioesterase [Methylobacterium sp. J-076]MCJ2013845.1 PaaI family thioesterase [Methylobacterium sp. J-076]
MTDDTAGGDPARDGWILVEDEGFIATVGPLYVREGIYAFRAGQKHANLIGVVHGGMLMSFADRALGVTAMAAADGASCVTIQLEMKFLDAGRMGDWLTCRSIVVKRTGSLVFMRGEVHDGERLVASADGVWKILRRRPA